MTEFSREEWIAAVRAEIERDGIHVPVSDDELWAALVTPIWEAERRRLQALADLGLTARRTTAAFERFAEAWRNGESIDQARADIANLPETSPEDER